MFFFNKLLNFEKKRKNQVIDPIDYDFIEGNIEEINFKETKEFMNEKKYI